MNISASDLAFMYKILENAVTSGKDTDRVYQLKMKLIGILKVMDEARPKTDPAVTESETPKVEPEVVAPEGTLDMK